MKRPVACRFNRGYPVYPGDLARIDGRRIKPANEGDPGAFIVPDDAQIEGHCVTPALKSNNFHFGNSVDGG